MHTQEKCDICGRRAKQHDTCAESGIVVERHLCGIHGRQVFLAAFKEALSAQAPHTAREWRTTSVSDSQLRERILDASSLREIGAMCRLDEMLESFLRNPPGI